MPWGPINPTHDHSGPLGPEQRGVDPHNPTTTAHTSWIGTTLSGSGGLTRGLPLGLRLGSGAARFRLLARMAAGISNPLHFLDPPIEYLFNLRWLTGIYLPLLARRPPCRFAFLAFVVLQAYFI